MVVIEQDPGNKSLGDHIDDIGANFIELENTISTMSNMLTSIGEFCSLISPMLDTEDSRFTGVPVEVIKHSVYKIQASLGQVIVEFPDITTQPVEVSSLSYTLTGISYYEFDNWETLISVNGGDFDYTDTFDSYMEEEYVYISEHDCTLVEGENTVVFRVNNMTTGAYFDYPVTIQATI